MDISCHLDKYRRGAEIFDAHSEPRIALVDRR